MSSPQGSPKQRASQKRNAAEDVSPGPASYWLVMVLRAIPALVVGLIITFIQDHSARIGLVSFGAFALVTGVVIAIGSARILSDRVTRGTFIAQGAIAAASGMAALALWNGGLGVLLLIVTVFAALTGMLELYAGLRAKGTVPARDWLTVGAYTAVAAVVFVFIPADSVLATGLIGVYGLMLGVFLVIAGLSLKWSTNTPVEDNSVEGRVSA